MTAMTIRKSSSGARRTARSSEKSGHGLLVAYLVDEGERYTYVQNRHLQATGLSAENLHEIGVANLRRLAEDKLEVKTYNGAYFAFMGGDFEASLILVPDIWSDWFGHLSTGGFVAAFPARDLLGFGDPANAGAVAELKAMCDRASASGVDHPLTNRLFTNVDGPWRPLG